MSGGLFGFSTHGFKMEREKMRYKIALAFGAWLTGDGLWSVFWACFEGDQVTFYFAAVAALMGGLLVGLSLPKLEEVR